MKTMGPPTYDVIKPTIMHEMWRIVMTAIEVDIAMPVHKFYKNIF